MIDVPQKLLQSDAKLFPLTLFTIKVTFFIIYYLFFNIYF